MEEPGPHTRQRALRGDQGRITAFVIPLMAALMAFGGLALDGGLALAAKVRALGEAQEAARAGAQALDLAAYRADGTVRLDPAQASRLAQDYLSDAGADGTVTATEDTVTVTITTDQDTHLLHLLGIHELTVTAEGTARPQPGITTPE